MAGDDPEPLTREDSALRHNKLRRNRALAELKAAYDLIKGLPAKGETFLARCSELKNCRVIFHELNSDIELLLAKHPSLSCDTLEISAEFDEMYFECMRLAEKLKPKPSTPAPPVTPQQSTSQQVQQQLRIPHIEIPVFKGDIDSFSSFISLFDAVIEKTSLTIIEKFAFLKSKLEGEPKTIVDSVPFDAANYPVAYNALKNAYNQPRVLIAHHLNKILNLHPLKSDNPTDLRELVNTIHVHVEALKNMAIADLGSQLLLQIALRLLPVKIKKDFESANSNNANITYDTLIVFLRKQCIINQLINESVKSDNTQKITRAQPTSKNEKSNNRKSLLATQQKQDGSLKNSDTPNPSCKLCSKAPHRLIRCFKFLEMTPSERLEVVRGQNRCEICLYYHPSSCKSKGVCKWCSSSNHNSFLCENRHSSNRSSTSNQSTTDSPPEADSSSSTCKTANSCSVNFANQLSSPVLLGTAQVRIKNSFDQWYGPTRVLTDTGSEVNFITESLTQILGLKRRKCPYQVTGVGQASPMEVRGIVTCTLASLHPPHQSITIEAIVASKISAEVPSTSLPKSVREQFSHLTLADPRFGSRNKVDLLLGVQATHDILSRPPEILPGLPSATKTIFGYVLSGAVEINEPPDQEPVRQSFVCQSVAPVDELLKKFWEMEEVSVTVPSSPEDEFCEKHFEHTTKRTNEGRYMVSLPFKNGVRPELGSTTEFALRSFHRLENKFKRDSKYRDMYNSNIQSYIQEGFIVKAAQPVSYILPHHGVTKESSTSPLRVVFNPSQLSSTSQTLNNSLCTGPKLQRDIGDIILNFRVNRVGMMCDIKSHYLSILLNPEDRQYQHFYFRFSPDQPIQEWEWTCVIFGMSSSPWLAQKTLKRLISDEKHKFPKAAQILDSSCYVDNIVFSVNSPEEATELHHELNKLLASGGFILRKWASSDASVSDKIDSELQEKPRPLGDIEAIRVLGLEWNPETDSFCYLVQPSANDKPTKRSVMSQIARIYDINGYLSPVVFSMKRLLQDIWLAGLLWDDELNSELGAKWCKILESLPSLASLRIPRYIMGENWTSVQLIGFGDASEAGMAAVLYLRVQLSSGEVAVNIIKAKTKVSPLRKISIPRLELGAAYILSLLVKSVQPFIDSLGIEEIHLFSDSTTTLAWIHTPPYKLATYVANRVVLITDNTPISSWRHVPTDQNPADLSSRGLSATELINSDMWWHGPSFLHQDISQWPSRNFIMPSEVPELKRNVQVLVATSTVADSPILRLLERCSSFQKVIRIVIYVHRFIKNWFLPKKDHVRGPRTADEYRAALNCCIKVTQLHYFPAEIQKIELGEQCSSKLRQLTPFVSSDGFLRVGGRLKNSPLKSGAKHPLLIPSDSPLATLICDFYHIYTLHGGPRIVRALIQRNYWIPQVGKLIRTRLSKCKVCFQYKAKPEQPQMGDLPPERFSCDRCFTNTAIDFCGPFSIKESILPRNTRTTKAYVAVMVCMSTKAIHLEPVSALSTEACLAALDRFISRRGLPAKIFSDQGRNFVGCDRALRDMQQLMKASGHEIVEQMSLRGIEWKFSPPYAPNFNGLAEAGVKSTKHHMKRVIGDQSYTFEELYTLLTRIEAILNSRPLCSLSNSPDDDFDFLTPGHFLTGAPLLARPDANLLDVPRNRLSRWQLISYNLQSFWRKWKREYLHTIIHRSKWTNPTPNVHVGDLVLLYDPNCPPQSWPLGRVEAVYPGGDRAVRVAKIRTPSGHLTRPVNRLVVLPRN